MGCGPNAICVSEVEDNERSSVILHEAVQKVSQEWFQAFQVHDDVNIKEAGYRRILNSLC